MKRYLDGHGQTGFEEDGASSAHRFSDEGEPFAAGAEAAGAMGGDGAVRSDSGVAGRASDIHSARRSAVCERQHSPGHRVQQGTEGFHRQVQDDGGFRLALRAGLGLPRAADRDQGRQSAGFQESGDDHGADPGGMPQLRREIRRLAAQGFHPARGSGALGGSLSDDERAVRVRHRGRVRRISGSGLCLQGPEAGQLVHSRPNRAGGGRSRIRGPHQPVDLGAISR